MRRNGHLPVFVFLNEVMSVRKRKKTDTVRKKDGDGRKPLAAAKVVALVNELAEPLCASEGMELVHVEYQREPGGWILRLYIDRPGGVTLSDCTLISRLLSDELDVTIENIGPYHLEVSSPGVNRPLGKAGDFERFRGHMAKIKTINSFAGKKSFRGILSGISGESVELLVEDQRVVIPLVEISRARLVNYNGEKRCL